MAQGTPTSTEPHVILPEIPEEKPFTERLKSLLSVDCIRFSRIMETMQYALLYACICLPVGIGIDAIFSNLYPDAKEAEEYTWKQTWQAIGVSILQVILNAVSIIYIRKLADLFPFFFNLCPSRYVAHYHVDEVFGEAAIALIYVGVQTSLIHALDKIRARFSARKASKD
jgi:hypothetical protein